MAEHKACADLVAVTGGSVANSALAGECPHSSPSSGVDDSGTESGEDFRLLSPEILAEVQNALHRLESALPGLDPSRREALVRLVNRLQSCLKLQPPTSTPSAPPPVQLPPPPEPPNPPPSQPPVKRYANRRQRHQRHTVGVSKEELADARRWLLETGQQTASSTGTPEVPSVDSQSSTNLNDYQEQTAVSQVFRPVKFTPNQPIAVDYDPPFEIPTQQEPFDTSGDNEEPVVLSAALSYSFPREVPKADSGSSLLEYDPSLVLFTPAQSVQIAVHKAAINKQISEEESKREHNKREESYDSDDGDVSSVEEDQSLTTGQEGLEDAISSAQRLLQIATDNKKTPTPSRFHGRNSKKQKMKRANTIDIPKPINFQEMEGSSPDEFGNSKDDINKDKYPKNKAMADQKLPQPPFQPKTESDLKFLAFLQQANKNEGKGAATYNPSARGGQPWTNRFVNIKTAFEATPETKPLPQSKTFPPSITQTWENNSTRAAETHGMRQAVQNRTPQPLLTKLPWTAKEEEEVVVVGSLTVKTSPGQVNKFSHAPKSAFRPIEKKPISQPQKVIIQPQKPIAQPQSKSVKKNNPASQQSKNEIKNSAQQLPNNKLVTTSVSGTVKQLATQKFSGENVPSKPIIKQYPVIQDKQFNAANSVKQRPFVDQISKPVNPSVPVNNVPPPQFSTSIASAHRQFSGQSEPDTAKSVKIPQKTSSKDYKDGSEYSPPKQYINSPPLSKRYAEPFEFPSEQRIAKEIKATKNYKDGNEYSPPKQYIHSPPHNKNYSEPHEYTKEQMINNSYPTLAESQFKNDVEEPLENSVPYYSQEPAYVQHSTYAQPLVNYSQQPDFTSQTSSQSFQQFPMRSQSVDEYHTQHMKPQYKTSFNQPDENQYLHGLADQYRNGNVSSTKVQSRSDPYLQNLKEDQLQHRFSEESLVPNPLVLAEVYKPASTEYLPYESSPVVPNKPLIPTITNNLYENNSSQGSLSSSKLSDSSSSIKQFLNIPYDYGQEISPAISNTSKSPFFDDNIINSGAPSPHWNQEDLEDQEISLSEGAEMQTAVSRVMGHAQCQKAVTVTNRTQHRYDDDRTESESLLRTLLKSPHSPTNMARKQSLEKPPVISDPVPQPSKSPLMDKPKNKLLPDNYSYPVVTKPPTVVPPQNERVQSLQGKQPSSAASAFRPLVNNLSKAPTSDVHRLPPLPSSPPTYNKKPDSDSRLHQTTTKVSSSSSSSNKYYESELLTKPYQSVSPSRSPSSTSPSFPNVLQKSESWHQLVKEQMAQGRHPPPKSPRLAKTKSSHSLAFPKQYEAHLTPDTLAVKQTTVDQYLKPTSTSKQSSKTIRQSSKQKKTVSIVKLDDNLDNVDEAFESLFQEVAKRK